MRRHIKWKMLTLFCSTFLLGFLSFDLSLSIIPNKSLKTDDASQLTKKQQIKEALKLAEKENLEGVP